MSRLLRDDSFYASIFWCLFSISSSLSKELVVHILYYIWRTTSRNIYNLITYITYYILHTYTLSLCIVIFQTPPAQTLLASSEPNSIRQRGQSQIGEQLVKP